MGKGFVKFIGSWVMAVAVAVAPIAHGKVDDSINIVEMTTSPQGPEGETEVRFSVVEVSPGDEGKVLTEAVNKNPNATLTLVGGPIDAIHPSILFSLQKRVVSYEEIKPTFKVPPKPAEANPAAKGPWLTDAKKQKLKSELKSVFITVKAAGSFATAYYLLGRDYAGVPEMLMNGEFANAVKPLLTGDPVSTAKAFGLATIISGYQIMFTSSWQKYLRSAGNVGRMAWTKVASAVGHTLKSGALSDRFGRLLGAYGFNLLTTSVILATLGGMDAITHMMTVEGAVKAGTLAAVASWSEVLDVFFGRQVERGQLTQQRYEKFVQYRLTYGPWVEGPALALSGTAIGMASATILAVVGTVGIVATLTLEPTQNYLAGRKLNFSERAPAQSKSIWQKVKEKFLRQKAMSKASCDELLEEEN